MKKSLYVLGDKKLCDELPGSYLGGFDPNRKNQSSSISSNCIEINLIQGFDFCIYESKK